MKKASRYNIWVDNVLYNSFSDQAISFLAEEVDIIKNFIQNPNEYEENLELIRKFEQLGLIVDIDFDELEYILFRNRTETFKKEHYTFNK